MTNLEIEAFMAVVRTGSITRAAQFLYTTPVSYTHLDVYKRQARHSPA